MSPSGGFSIRGVLHAGGSPSGGSPSRGGVHPGGFSIQGGSPSRGFSIQGGPPSRGSPSRGGGLPCDLSHHAFDVTCMLPPHQLRPTNSAAAYIVLGGHVTYKASWDTTPPVNRITHTCKNITFPQLCLRAVMIRFLSEILKKHTKLAKIVKISEIFNRLVFPLNFNRFCHSMTLRVRLHQATRLRLRLQQRYHSKFLYLHQALSLCAIVLVDFVYMS